MAVVAYLLGAGASAECLPVVNGMADDMDILTAEISKYFNGGGFALQEKYKPIIDVLYMLRRNCLHHFSIDTYAKKLYLTDRDAFEKLKLDLSLYFTLRQILTRADKRYDNFLSSIMTTRRSLPSKVKIISWNYDYQIERSYYEFNNQVELDSCQLSLGVNSPKSHRDYDDCKGKFNILKLNGSAKIKTASHNGFLVSLINRDTTDQILDVVERYLDIINNNSKFECELKFAWENENYESLFKKAADDLGSIEVLVIIGYSFPFYNRQVDRELFRKMSKLHTIYIQDLSPESIHETMKEFFDFTNVVYKTNVKQFVFPRELDIT